MTLPTRVAGHPEDILESVVDRLIQEVNGLTAANCFLALNPDQIAPSPAGNQLFVVVAPMSGQFNEGYFDGGASFTLFAESGLLTKIHSILLLDPQGRDDIFLTHDTKGVLQMARKVLNALIDTNGWSSKNDAGEFNTRDPLIPRRWTLEHKNPRHGSLEIEWGLNFDWDVNP